MKAIRYHRYGGPEVLELSDLDLPVVGDDDILIQVKAASVNPLDFHFLRGEPYLVRLVAGLPRPRVNGLGTDLAGCVESVGRNVTRFQPGDEVYGAVAKGATFAEYVSVSQDGTVLAKPATLTYEQAAAVPLAGFTALQALRDKGRVRAGYRVLVNGASGGVGTFAVQLAKAYGAEVTGVCGTRNLDLVSGIGAEHVIDYTRDDFTRAGRRYDVLIDLAGNHTLTQLRRALTPKGVLVAIGGPIRNQWTAPVTGPLTTVLRSLVVSQTLSPFLTRQSRDDLAVLTEFIDAGKITPVLDRTYPLSAVPDAIHYLEAGHANGKVVITG